MVLTDTGYWLALANPRDKHHLRAIEITKTINTDMVITWPVITEVCHLLSTRMGTHSSISFLREIEQDVVLFNMGPEHLNRVTVLMKKYRDLPMDLADASLVIAAEELGHGNILSTDQRDFGTYRWKHRKPFNNLLIP